MTSLQTQCPKWKLEVCYIPTLPHGSEDVNKSEEMGGLRCKGFQSNY